VDTKCTPRKKDATKYEGGDLAAVLEKKQLFYNLVKTDIERLGRSPVPVYSGTTRVAETIIGVLKSRRQFPK
jgi:hypothetical protein